MKTTAIEIDKMRKLRFDFNAMADLEAVTRKPFELMIMPLSMSSADAVRAILWAGLKWEDPDLKMMDAGNLAQEWIEKSGSDIGGLTEVLIDALTDAGWLKHDESSEAPAGSGQGEAEQASVA